MKDLLGVKLELGDRVVVDYHSKQFSCLALGYVIFIDEEEVKVQTKFGTQRRTKSQEIVKVG